MRTILKIGHGPQMFFDNELIEDLVGLRRRFAGFEKPDGPFFARETPWEEPCGPVIASLLRDEEGYRLWYEIPYETAGGPMDPCFVHREPGRKTMLSTGETAEDGLRHHRYEKVLYAHSRDGVHWERPELNILPEFGEGSNVVLIGPHGRTNGMALVVDENAAPDRRYAALYQGKMAVYLAFSPDGLHWTHHPGPVIPYYNDTALTVLQKPEGGYRLYGRNCVYAGNWQRRIAVYESDDLIHWSEPSTILLPEDTNDEYYGLRPYRYGDFYVGLLMWLYSTSSSTLDCEWVFSRDGLHWQHSGCKALPLGGMGAFDAFRAVYTNYLEPVGEELHACYVGCDARHNAKLEEKNFALGMARMRRDGFCWLDATDADFIGQRVQTAMTEDRVRVRDEGHLLTRPFWFDGTALEINADASHGYVQVGILDMETKARRYVTIDPAEGSTHVRDFPWTDVSGHVASDADVGYVFVEGAHEAPFEGVGIADCDALCTDEVFHRVSWRGVSDLSHLKGKAVRLQIHLRGAKLYSFRVVE